MESKHEKPKQREFVQDILCNNKEAIYGYNKAIKQYDAWILERLNQVFDKNKESISRPIANKEGKVTAVLLVDMRDYVELVDEIKGVSDGK